MPFSAPRLTEVRLTSSTPAVLFDQRRRHRPFTLARLAVCVVALGSLLAPPIGRADDADRRDESHWVGTWTASPQHPEPPVILATPSSVSDQTLRQIAHVSIGGPLVRVRLSNEFGTTALKIGAAHIALQSQGESIIPGTDRTLTFSGKTAVTIPAGAPLLSDPVRLDVPALSNVAVSLYLPAPTPTQTFHSLGVQTTYVSTPGNSTAMTTLPVASTTTSWFFLSGIAVNASDDTAAIVAIGDSITDGFNSTVDANRRWPNLLAARLQASRRLRDLAVLDHGISGNRTTFDFIGPNALARFDRDVLVAPGVKYVILLEGINNIGIPGAFGLSDQFVTADEIIASYEQMIARAHERGLKIFGGTLTPFEGTTIPGYYTAAGEAKRATVNRWIRTRGKFDAVIDFDKATRDPTHPTRFLPAYDSGDHLHPNDAGYAAMADAIDLGLFSERD